MKPTMPRDERVRGERGRYETRLVTRGGAVDGSADICTGNGARVRLIVSAEKDTSDVTSQLFIGPMSGNSVAPLITLTAERAYEILRIEDYGDVVMGTFRASSTAGWGAINVWEVIWHPEEM